MAPRRTHNVFSTAYSGLAKELVSEAEIIDPISQRSLLVRKVIWDTGATNTAIHRTIAASLRLVATGQARVHVANGQAAIEPTYVIDLGLRMSKVVIEGLNVSEGDLGPGTDVLIGMDVIALGDFTVQNQEGKTHFAFCIPPFENKYDMVEKGRVLNARATKGHAKRPT